MIVTVVEEKYKTNITSWLTKGLPTYAQGLCLNIDIFNGGIFIANEMRKSAFVGRYN